MKGDPLFSDIPAKSARYYDRNLSTYSDTNPNPADFIDEFVGFVENDRGTKGKILDLGSGHGVNAAYMQSKGFDVIGIDLSQKMIEYARKNYLRVNFRLIDMTKLSFPDRSFDRIFASYSLDTSAKRPHSSNHGKIKQYSKGRWSDVPLYNLASPRRDSTLILPFQAIRYF